MAIANYSAFKNSLAAAPELPFQKQRQSSGSSIWTSLWSTGPESPSAPSAAAACNNQTPGAMFTQDLLDAYTASRWLASLELASNSSTCLMLVDRLSHQGGLSGTVTTTQTTNLPTSALTRYGSGAGVMAAVEVYSAVGTGLTTLTASYTNQAGVSGRTSKEIAFGGTANGGIAGHVRVLPLQDGDAGVRSVESVTLASTTSTSGNFGITLFKPLMLLPRLQDMAAFQHSLNGLLGNGGCLPQIVNGACLSLLNFTSGASTPILGSMKFVEG